MDLSLDLYKNIIKKIIVIGYYNRGNLGDEAFKPAFVKLINHDSVNAITFVCVDDLNTINVTDYDVVIIGGGDIFNNYFIPKIENILRSFCGLVLAIGIGFPFEGLINKVNFKLYSHIFTRNLEDVRQIQINSHSTKAHFLPDIVFALDNDNDAIIEMTIKRASSYRIISSPRSLFASFKHDNKENYKEKHKENHKKGKCGVFLVQNNIKFDFIVQAIVVLLTNIAKTHKIIFYTFNTGNNGDENDEEISQLIAKKIAKNGKPINIVKLEDPLLINDSISKLSMAVCVRFHSHIFAMMANVPFISISTCRKTNVLMKQIGLTNNQYCVQLDGYEKPISAKSADLLQVYKRFNKVETKSSLRQTVATYSQLLQSNVISQLITNYGQSPQDNSLSFVMRELTEKNSYDKMTLAKIISKHACGISESKYVYGIYEKLNKSKDIEEIKTVIRESINYIREKTEENANMKRIERLRKRERKLEREVEKATKMRENKKSDKKGNKKGDKKSDKKGDKKSDKKGDKKGNNKIDKVPSTDSSSSTSSLECISLLSVSRSASSLSISLPNRASKVGIYFDLSDYYSYKNAHRGGWYIAIKEINKIKSRNGLYCDFYVDRTFLWNEAYNKHFANIPYTMPWCGFIHHTTYEGVDNNVLALFKKKSFLNSLGMCRILFTLSPSLAYVIRNILMLNNIVDVTVISLIHPIVFPTLKFAHCSRIVQIGSWLRNSYSIYALKTKMNKFVLLGEDMSDMRLPDAIYVVEGKAPNHSHAPSCLPMSCVPCRPHHNSIPRTICDLMKYLRNNYNVSYLEFYDDKLYIQSPIEETINKIKAHIAKAQSSIIFINKLSNEEYDILLSTSVVFLDLFDSATVNTVIECIVRETPMIINKTAGVVDLLGDNYPSYYDNMDTQYNIDKRIKFLLKEKSINKTIDYLRCIDNNRFNISYFIDGLRDAIAKYL